MEEANQTLTTLIEQLKNLEARFDQNMENTASSQTLGKGSPYYGTSAIASFTEEYYAIVTSFNLTLKQNSQILNYLHDSPREMFLFKPYSSTNGMPESDEEVHYKNNIYSYD